VEGFQRSQVHSKLTAKRRRGNSWGEVTWRVKLGKRFEGLEENCRLVGGLGIDTSQD